MNKQEKITCLKEYLDKPEESYADSFKWEIGIILGDFQESNPNLRFLENLSDEAAIYAFVDQMTSRIVMKFNPEWEILVELCKRLCRDWRIEAKFSNSSIMLSFTLCIIYHTQVQNTLS